ncbi:hypothetical protein Hsar01_00450 [Haloferula sargassicola]|uniref:Uncharacterized protein n=2 Tax=Haloferula sargassicola TaxID=490096 RepID=A0ABP9UHW2_9BACT
MMFGVFAGLAVRALPELQEMAHHHGVCHHETPSDALVDGHDHGKTCDHDHTGDGNPHVPCHHHHDGCCGSPLNLSAEYFAAVSLSPPGGSLLGVGLHHDRMPDPPVFEEDAPPLI